VQERGSMPRMWQDSLSHPLGNTACSRLDIVEHIHWDTAVGVSNLPIRSVECPCQDLHKFISVLLQVFVSSLLFIVNYKSLPNCPSSGVQVGLAR
jgi:hypothetical protein